VPKAGDNQLIFNIAKNNMVKEGANMKNVMIILSALFLFTAEGRAQDLTNALSPEEEADGYELLFNGEDLDEWRSYGEPDIIGEAWQVKTDGEAGTRLETVAGVSGNRVSLMTRKTFRNFDLKIEWSCPPEGNSGIFYRYLDDHPDEWNEDGRTGPEVQIKGPDYYIQPGSVWDVGRRGYPGACYQIKGPDEDLEEWFNDWGQYNEFRVVAYEKKVAHYGNGLKLLEYEIDSPQWTEAYENSVYKNAPLYGEVHAGSIRLEHKNLNGLRFRNIRIKELTEDPWEGKDLGELPGMLPLSYNFNPEIEGCLDSSFMEYNAEATVHVQDSCATVGIGVYRGFTNPDVQMRPTGGGRYSLHLAQGMRYLHVIRVDGSLQFSAEIRTGDDTMFPVNRLSPGCYIISGSD
jgi:hypothetical protein